MSAKTFAFRVRCRALEDDVPRSRSFDRTTYCCSSADSNPAAFWSPGAMMTLGLTADLVDPSRLFTEAEPSPEPEKLERDQAGVLAHGPH